MYTVTLNELKCVLKVSAKAGQNCVMNKTSVESATQDDDFQEVKRCKRNIFNYTSQSAKKSTKPVPTSAAVKLVSLSHPSELMTWTRRLLKQRTLPEQEVTRKPGRPPTIAMTSTANLIRIQSDLNPTRGFCN
jgi:hypothetical protein